MLFLSVSIFIYSTKVRDSLKMQSMAEAAAPSEAAPTQGYSVAAKKSRAKRAAEEDLLRSSPGAIFLTKA